MNTLDIRTVAVSDGYSNECFFIDDIPLHEYMKKWCQDIPVEDLAITWNASFDFDGDARFMRFLLQTDKMNLPILSCPDDLDFSCTVIVAEVEKTNKYVLWKRIGTVNHSIENFEEEKEHGIVFADNYSDEDWIKYRDAAFMRVDSAEWCEWISANLSEELFRRRINYTYPCYQKEENIDWIYNCSWWCDREQYDRLAGSCKPKRWGGQ